MVFELLVLTFFTPLGNVLYIHVHTSQSHFLHARRCTGVVLAVDLCLCISGSLCHKSEAGRTTVVFSSASEVTTLWRCTNMFLLLLLLMIILAGRLRLPFTYPALCDRKVTDRLDVRVCNVPVSCDDELKCQSDVACDRLH